MLLPQLSLIYLNESNAIQQSIFNGFKWSNSPVFASSIPPDDNSKLSISTRMIGNYVQALGSSSNTTYQATATGLAPVQQLVQQLDQVAVLSSVAFYQNGHSVVMVDLSPIANIQRDPHLNPNLFSRFNGTDNLIRYTDIGFSCDHDRALPTDASSFLTRCYLADWGIPPELSITPKTWKYNQKTLQSNSTINQSDVNICVDRLQPLWVSG